MKCCSSPNITLSLLWYYNAYLSHYKHTLIIQESYSDWTILNKFKFKKKIKKNQWVSTLFYRFHALSFVFVYFDVKTLKIKTHILKASGFTCDIDSKYNTLVIYSRPNDVSHISYYEYDIVWLCEFWYDLQEKSPFSWAGLERIITRTIDIRNNNDNNREKEFLR